LSTVGDSALTAEVMAMSDYKMEKIVIEAPMIVLTAKQVKRVEERYKELCQRYQRELAMWSVPVPERKQISERSYWQDTRS